MAAAPTARSSTRPPTRIRWDRISRYGLLIVFVGLLYLYVNPARSYLDTRREAGHRQAQLHALQREHAMLTRRMKALADPHEIETEARQLGMVKPGERPYIVSGLPRGN